MTTLMSPTFSVVVPLHNKKHFVRRAIDSVLAQTSQCFQLIVVDDGSTDGSADIVAEIDDRRLELYRQPNQGPGPARNAGMARARHDWIAFLDADDYWFADHLAELSRIAVERPDAGLISTRRYAVSGHGEILRPEGGPRHLRQIDLLSGTTYGLIHTSAAAMPRQVFEATGGFGNFPHGQDREFWLRISLSYPIVVSSRVTTLYLRGTGGIMDQRAERGAEEDRPVYSLEDVARVSPTVKFVVDALAEDKYPESREKLRAYVNRRLQHYAGKSVQYGHIARARSIMRLLVGPVPVKVRLYQFILCFPGFIVRPVISALNSRNLRTQGTGEFL